MLVRRLEREKVERDQQRILFLVRLELEHPHRSSRHGRTLAGILELLFPGPVTVDVRVASARVVPLVLKRCTEPVRAREPITAVADAANFDLDENVAVRADVEPVVQSRPTATDVPDENGHVVVEWLGFGPIPARTRRELIVAPIPGDSRSCAGFCARRDRMGSFSRSVPHERGMEIWKRRRRRN